MCRFIKRRAPNGIIIRARIQLGHLTSYGQVSGRIEIRDVVRFYKFIRV